MPCYRLSASAREDIKAIARYTLRKWGPDQAQRYQELLTVCFRSIAQREIRPRIFLKRRADLLFTRCEHHYVFYILPEGDSPLIIAVFHENMDLMVRIRQRLHE